MHGTRIYLDNNATTRILPEVATCVADHWQNAFANAGSQHSFGRDARRVLEDSRESLAAILNADPSELIFTSCGTESVNTAVYGFTFGRSGAIALTGGEHPAVRQACLRACQSGLRTIILEVDEHGQLNEEQFGRLPWNELRLVCVILAHNETGVIQNTTRLSEMCRHHNVPLLLDAVQAVGRIPVNFQELDAAALAFGAHKFHGPRGVGGLLLRRGVRVPPLLEGGHQENGRRAGTESVALIGGMARALEIWQAEYPDQHRRVTLMRDTLQNYLLQDCTPAIVHGINSARLPNTLSMAFPGIPGEALLVNLDLAGVACSLGSACASGSAEPAPGLLAMGISRDVCQSSVRFSLSKLNTLEEIEDAAARISRVIRRMRSEKQISHG
jgi:cysteine desulfurase